MRPLFIECIFPKTKVDLLLKAANTFDVYQVKSTQTLSGAVLFI